MQNFLKEKINLEREKLRKNNLILKGFIIIFFVGYAAFFSSSFLMPKNYKVNDLTAIGKTYSTDNFTAIVDSWDYITSKNEMQVIMEISAISLDEEPEFKLKCGNNITKGKNIRKVEPNYYVVDFKNIPYIWSEASMTVIFGDKYIKFNTNDKRISKIKKQEEKTNEEIIFYAKKSKIKGLQAYLEELDKTMKKQGDRKVAVYEKFDKIVNSPEPTDDKERQVYTNQKAELKRKLDEADADLMESGREYAAINKKIEEETLQLKELKEEKK